MKSIKVLIAAIALGVASTPALQAQQKKGGMSPEEQIARIEQAVGSLTAQQKSKIEAIMAKTREEMQAVPKEERKEKGAAMQKKQREDIAAVLTPEQREKYMAMGGGGKKKKNN